MKRTATILLWLLAAGLAAQEAVQIRFSLESIGVIRRAGQEAPIGTAFVIGEKRSLVTADHVVDTVGLYTFEAVQEGAKQLELKVRYRIPRYDLAVLDLVDPEGALSGRPFKAGDFRRLRPGDTVVYLGWNAPSGKVAIREAVISAIGEVDYQGNIVDFVEFIGEGIPGFSGGPVLDLDGNVVAMMHEAWTKRGVKGGRTVLVNRAFSVEVFAEIEREVVGR